MRALLPLTKIKPSDSLAVRACETKMKKNEYYSVLQELSMMKQVVKNMYNQETRSPRAAVPRPLLIDSPRQQRAKSPPLQSSASRPSARAKSPRSGRSQSPPSGRRGSPTHDMMDANIYKPAPTTFVSTSIFSVSAVFSLSTFSFHAVFEEWADFFSNR